MYHRIAVDRFDPWRLTVAPEKFDQQLEWLAQHRTILRLIDFAELHRKGRLPGDAIALTFDDGYACTAEVAAPLLEEQGAPATIFLATEAVRKRRSFWWDELQQVVLEHPHDQLTLGGERIAVGERQPDDDQWPPGTSPQTPRQLAFYNLWLRLRTLRHQELESAMRELREQAAPSDEQAAHRLMTAEQVGSIRSKQIEFGSHGQTHSSLPGLPRSEKAEEIQKSLAACQALTGSRPETFAYPFGDFDAESQGLVEEAGYRCACTAEPRPVRRSDSPHALPRIHVEDWTSGQLAAALNQLALAG